MPRPWVHGSINSGRKYYGRRGQSHVGTLSPISTGGVRGYEAMHGGANRGKWNRIDPRGVHSTPCWIAVVVVIGVSGLVVTARITWGRMSRAQKKGSCQTLGHHVRLGMTGDSPGEDFEVVVGRGCTRCGRRWSDDLYDWNLTRLIPTSFSRGWGNGIHLNPVGFIRNCFRRRLGDNVYNQTLFEGYARTTRRGFRGKAQSLSLNPLPRPEGCRLPFLEKCVPQRFPLLQT